MTDGDIIELAINLGVGDADLSDSQVISDYGDITEEVLKFARALLEARDFE